MMNEVQNKKNTLSERNEKLKKILDNISFHLRADVIIILIVNIGILGFKSLLATNISLILISITSLTFFFITYLNILQLSKQIRALAVDSAKILNEGLDNNHSNISQSLEETSLKINKVVDSLYHTFGITTKYITNVEDGNEIIDLAYKESIEVIKSAKKSIWIVGDYSPARDQLIATEDRLEYFQSIESIIADKIRRKQKFDYRRIMQRNELIYKQIKNDLGKITTEEQIKGDEQAFNHCRRVMRLIATENWLGVYVSLVVAPVVPSLPSILLVDEKHLLFTIPKKLVGAKIQTESVIHFTDNRPDSPMIKSFKNIFQSVFEDDDKHNLSEISDNIFFKYESIQEKKSTDKQETV